MKILITGINGCMGKAVADEIRKIPAFSVLCGVDTLEKKPYNSYSGAVYPSFDQVKETPDCIVDFSSPSALSKELRFAREKKVGVVIGTTSLTEIDYSVIEKFSEDIPIFLSSNFSLGVHLLKILSVKAAKLFKSADVEIIEKHHKDKKDAPSGTALTIAKAIQSAKKENVHFKTGRTEKRRKGEIGIHSVRGGTIVGDHEVVFAANGETITISHRAENKNIFALGALSAAVFLQRKQNGLYGMDDLFSDLK
ncbi:MAG: 4-hydroxy-tetrahydrodipicolinate reductase [Clostridia bacterium]|nr:4-hydroxy-tetrahydrodipicolinate reductase [Clostridia bacterium]